MIKISIIRFHRYKTPFFLIFCNNSDCFCSCKKKGKAMISEQIIEDYLEHENDYNQLIKKIKVTVLLISITGLIIFSL